MRLPLHQLILRLILQIVIPVDPVSDLLLQKHMIDIVSAIPPPNFFLSLTVLPTHQAMQFMMHPQLRRVPRSIRQWYRCQIVVVQILLPHLDSNICGSSVSCMRWRDLRSRAAILAKTYYCKGGAREIDDAYVPSNRSCHAASNSGRGGPENGFSWSWTGRWRCSYSIAWLDARAVHQHRVFLVSESSLSPSPPLSRPERMNSQGKRPDGRTLLSRGRQDLIWGRRSIR